LTLLSLIRQGVKQLFNAVSKIHHARQRQCSMLPGRAAKARRIQPLGCVRRSILAKTKKAGREARP